MHTVILTCMGRISVTRDEVEEDDDVVLINVDTDEECNRKKYSGNV